MRRLVFVGAGVVAAVFLAAVVVTNEDGVLGESMMSVDDVDLSALDRVPESTWRTLAQQRICFGHQSVGGNILTGVADILQRNPKIQLTLLELQNPSDLDRPCLAHFPIGRNEDPPSKIDAFAAVMAGEAGRRADIALFKLCYVDIQPHTNGRQLARDYLDALARLEREHPSTSFVCVTAPLTSVESGMKTRVKKLLGKPLWGYQENQRRSEFNEILRRECRDDRPLFDLARIESTMPNGEATWFCVNGTKTPCLAATYTDDGGHLNDAGRLIAAREFLLTLADVAQNRTD